MSFSTATHRLKKMLTFSMARELKRNFCFRCTEEILCYEDLSVDHKEPWQDVSAELFWDLKNVAFSHLKCNVGCCRRKGRSDIWKIQIHRRAAEAPPEQAWCVNCGYLNVSEFHSNKRNPSKCASYCKKCTRDRYLFCKTEEYKKSKAFSPTIL